MTHNHECGACHSLYVCACLDKAKWALCLKCRIMTLDDAAIAEKEDNDAK